MPRSATRARETTPAPDVATLQRALSEAEGRRSMVAGELLEIQRLTSPYTDRSGPEPSRAAFLRAAAREQTCRAALRLAEAEVEDAGTALAGVARAERAQRAEADRVRLRPHVRRFVEAMERAAEAHDAMVSAGGPVCVALGPDGGLFAHWCRSARESGLID